MKKLINGLRRKTTPTTKTETTTTHDNPQQETNYADLFDNDQDESAKENTKNNTSKKLNSRNGGGKPKRRKKRIQSKPAIMNAGGSRGMQTMMTISEIVDDEEEGVDDSTIVGVDNVILAENYEEEICKNEKEEEIMDEGAVSIVEERGAQEEGGELDEVTDVTTAMSANLNDSGAIYSDSDSSEECAAENGNEELGESLVVLEESVAGEMGADNSHDDDHEEEVIVAPADVESSTDEVIDESDNDSCQEIIIQQMNSAEVPSQQQQQQQQHVSHYNINQVHQRRNTDTDRNADVSKENAHHEYLKSIGLYTPSNFMQSLRMKYRVDLECHA